LSITNSNFTSHTAERYGSDIFADSGSTTITGLNFTIIPNPSSIYINGGNFTASDIRVINSETSNTVTTLGVNGGAIYATNTDDFSVTASIFSNINFAELGGAIYMTYLASSKADSIPDTASFSIASTTFTNNVAIKGGAIYVDNVDYAQITSCTFTSNQAVTKTSVTDGNGEGGAIYYASKGKLNDLIDYRLYFSVGI
jgi:predicted outer membrane repeat protein